MLKPKLGSRDEQFKTVKVITEEQEHVCSEKCLNRGRSESCVVFAGSLLAMCTKTRRGAFTGHGAKMNGLRLRDWISFRDPTDSISRSFQSSNFPFTATAADLSTNKYQAADKIIGDTLKTKSNANNDRADE